MSDLDRELSKEQEDTLKDFENQGLTQDFLWAIRDPRLSPEQITALARGFEMNIAPEKIEVYARPELEPIQMTQVHFMANLLSAEQLEQVVLGLVDKLNFAQVRLYAQPEFSTEQMKILREALKVGLTTKEVEKFADKNLSVDELKEKRLAALIDAAKKSPTVELIKMYFTEEQNLTTAEKCDKIGLSTNNPIVSQAKTELIFDNMPIIDTQKSFSKYDLLNKLPEEIKYVPLERDIHKYPDPEIKQPPVNPKIEPSDTKYPDIKFKKHYEDDKIAPVLPELDSWEKRDPNLIEPIQRLKETLIFNNHPIFDNFLIEKVDSVPVILAPDVSGSMNTMRPQKPIDGGYNWQLDRANILGSLQEAGPKIQDIFNNSHLENMFIMGILGKGNQYQNDHSLRVTPDDIIQIANDARREHDFVTRMIDDFSDLTPGNR